MLGQLMPNSALCCISCDIMPIEIFEPMRTYKFTSEEFRAKKAAYQAKYGATVYVPGFDDIIHVSRFKAMSAEEKAAWSSRQFNNIPEGRREEIRKEKARKKEKFLAMLSSPTPDIAQNAGTLLTALDDAQDAVSTLACVATIGAKVLGASAIKALSGPIGWAWLASDLMNMINPVSRASAWWRAGDSGREPKRVKDRLTEWNPSTKKGKAKTAERIRKWKPTSANVCEALQTTDQLFGIGLSFGPIVGFAQDMVFAGWKTHMGYQVDIKFTPRARAEWTDAALKTYYSCFATSMLPTIMEKKDEIDVRIGPHFATQLLYEDITADDPLQYYEDNKRAIIHAPIPTDMLTLEIIAETTGKDLRVGLPGLGGRPHAEYAEVLEVIQDRAQDRNEKFALQHRHEIDAMVASECSSMGALNMLSAIEGEDQIDTDYVVQSKVIHKIYNNGWMYPLDISEKQINQFNFLINESEKMSYNPSSSEIQRLAKEGCGFEFVDATSLSGW